MDKEEAQKAPKDVLQDLHTFMCTELREELKALPRGEKGRAAIFTVIARFLKDNGIEALASPKSPIAALLADLPFGEYTFTQGGTTINH